MMASSTAVGRPTRSVTSGLGGRGATRVVIAVLGTIVGLAGVEHGLGEILQGRGRPDALFIESWLDAAALEILSGEPAMTVVPDLLLTGVLAVVVGLLVVAWSVGFVGRRHGGAVLIGLSLVLLLVGGGLGPPLMGVILGAVAMRGGTAPRRPPGRVASGLARWWPWFLTGAVVGYLGLMPGMLVAHPLGIASAMLVTVLGVVAFANLGLALVAARAHDRVAAGVAGRPA
jgi:hypothetical protein